MATPFPETWLADSSLHTYCFTAGFAASPDPSVGTYGMSVLDTTTDMTISDYGTPCDDNTADVWWFSLNLAAGIRGKLYRMPDETVIYPGHGPVTKVGYEKRTNPFVNKAG